MKSPEAWLIKNGKIVFQDGTILENGALLVNEGKIAWIGTDANLKQFDAIEEVVDAQGSWVLPGFIDVHVHGGFGADFMDASRESLETITRFHSKNGTTAMLATTMTAPHEGISAVLSVVDD